MTTIVGKKGWLRYPAQDAIVLTGVPKTLRGWIGQRVRLTPNIRLGQLESLTYCAMPASVESWRQPDPVP